MQCGCPCKCQQHTGCYCFCCKILHAHQLRRSSTGMMNYWLRLVDLGFPANVHDCKHTLAIVIFIINFIFQCSKIVACLIFMACQTHKNILTWKLFAQNFQTKFFSKHGTWICHLVCIVQQLKLASSKVHVVHCGQIELFAGLWIHAVLETLDEFEYLKNITTQNLVKSSIICTCAHGALCWNVKKRFNTYIHTNPTKHHTCVYM